MLLKLEEACVAYLEKERDSSAAVDILLQLMSIDISPPDECQSDGLTNIQLPNKDKTIGYHMKALSSALNSPQQLLNALRDPSDENDESSLAALVKEVTQRTGDFTSLKPLITNLPIVVSILLKVNNADTIREREGNILEEKKVTKDDEKLQCAVPSQLFIRALKAFLSVQLSPEETSGRSKSNEIVELDKQSAAFLVSVLLQQVPLELLLNDGIAAYPIIQ